MLMTASFLRQKFEQAHPNAELVQLGELDGHRPPWDQRYGQLELDEPQRALVHSFTRPMKILCLTGTWCGDCALQGAAMQRIAEQQPALIDLRFVLRSEEHADLIVPNRLNGGFRVPLSWFMAEDFEPVSRFGDRTLSRYRSMARKQLPADAVVVTADPPADPVRTVLQEVLAEFERVHLILRLSPRLRERHGD